LRAVSFEYIPVSAERAVACIERLENLADYEFRPSAVETMRWSASTWLSGATAKAWLRSRPLQSGSGDMYARLRCA
jgi:hypothetical protein